MSARVLLVAKAPVAGQVKTRLGASIGMGLAAEIAAASLLDTLAACREYAGPAGCHLSLAGDLDEAVRGTEIREALAGWTVFPQHGDGFAERLVNAHGDVPGDGAVVQIGMDTPQVTAALLERAAAGLATHDAVLGPAEDGGWWVLGLTDPGAAAALADVAMSTPTTYLDTREALAAAGHRVTTTAVLRDVDTIEDAEAVALGAPDGEFARAWERRTAGDVR